MKEEKIHWIEGEEKHLKDRKKIQRNAKKYWKNNVKFIQKFDLSKKSWELFNIAIDYQIEVYELLKENNELKKKIAKLERKK